MGLRRAKYFFPFFSLLLCVSVFGAPAIAPQRLTRKACAGYYRNLADLGFGGRVEAILDLLADSKSSQSVKCARWEEFAKELRKERPGFQSNRLELADGTIMYRGAFRAVLLVSKSGEIYTTMTDLSNAWFQEWDAATATRWRKSIGPRKAGSTQSQN